MNPPQQQTTTTTKTKTYTTHRTFYYYHFHYQNRISQLKLIPGPSQPITSGGFVWYEGDDADYADVDYTYSSKYVSINWDRELR